MEPIDFYSNDSPRCQEVETKMREYEIPFIKRNDDMELGGGLVLSDTIYPTIYCQAGSFYGYGDTAFYLFPEWKITKSKNSLEKTAQN